jgi:hypothetical protein
VVLRNAVAAPEWELRVGRHAAAVPSVGSLAALDALRTAATPAPALRHAA